MIRGVLGGMIAFLLVLVPGPPAGAQENPLEPLDSSSPQATYLSFVDQIAVLEELLQEYERDRSEANQSAFGTALDKVESLFDLSQVSEATRSEVLVLSFARLADILNRIPPPDIEEIPDAEDVEDASTVGQSIAPETDLPILRAETGITTYTLPGTEITIVRLDEGQRAGEYVFSAETIARLGGWRDEVDDLPVNDGVIVRDWVQ